MTPANPPAPQVIRVQLTADHIQDADGGFPATYPVLLGLSRPLLPYEPHELAQASDGFIKPTDDPIWVAAVNTTLDEVQVRLSDIDGYLATAAQRASSIREAAQALADGDRVEVGRRLKLEQEINNSLSDRRGGGP